MKRTWKPTRAALKAVDDGVQALGGIVATQKAFKLKTQWSVRKWLKNGLPPDRVLKFESMVKEKGADISRHVLRPDRYPLEHVS